MKVRAGLFFGSCVVILLGVGGANAWALGARSMRDSDAALAQGRPREAAVAARVAAEAVVIGSPYPAEGYARLEALARANEAAGVPDEAAFDWRAIRSAAVATRPSRAGLGKVELADEGILRVARLAATVPRRAAPAGASQAAASVVPGAPEAIVRNQLAEDR